MYCPRRPASKFDSRSHRSDIAPIRLRLKFSKPDIPGSTSQPGLEDRFGSFASPANQPLEETVGKLTCIQSLRSTKQILLYLATQAAAAGNTPAAFTPSDKAPTRRPMLRRGSHGPFGARPAFPEQFDRWGIECTSVVLLLRSNSRSQREPDVHP